MRFVASQYAQAIMALQDAAQQLVPDGRCCLICHDTGHMAWECGHNPLRAMAQCEGIAKGADTLHDRLHAIEAAMDDTDQSEAIAEWREDAHDFLHHLAGHETSMGHQVGPASAVLPEALSALPPEVLASGGVPAETLDGTRPPGTPPPLSEPGRKSINDKIGVLATLQARLFLNRSVIVHCKANGEDEGTLANNRRDERALAEAIRFIEEHAQ